MRLLTKILFAAGLLGLAAIGAGSICWAQNVIDPTYMIQWPLITGAGAPSATCVATSPAPVGSASYGQRWLNTSAGGSSYTCGTMGWIQDPVMPLFGASTPASACSTVLNNGALYNNTAASTFYICNGATAVWNGPFGAQGPIGNQGVQGVPGGAANIGAAVQGALPVYDTISSVKGLDPLLGRIGDGTTTIPVAPLNVSRYIPVKTRQLPLTGNLGVEFAGNSITQGTRSDSGGTCATGTATATGNCWADLLTQDMGLTTAHNNYAVPGDLICDTAMHALNSSNPTLTDNIVRNVLNALNDSDTKDRGAYENVTEGCERLLYLHLASTAANRVRGDDAGASIGTGAVLDTTYTNFHGVTFSANAQTATFSFTVSAGGIVFPKVAYVLYRTVDSCATEPCSGDTRIPGAIEVSSGSTALFMSNTTPVPVATFNGAKESVRAVRLPIGIGSSNTITVTSVMSGAQNWAEVLGIIYSPQPTTINSFSITGSVPTFTAANTVIPAVNQKIIMHNFGTGQYFNGQTLTVTGVSGSLVTTTAPVGTSMPSTLGATSEANGMAYPAYPVVFAAGNSRNKLTDAINDRAVNVFDKRTRNNIRNLQGDGFQDAIQYVNLQTCWLNDEQSVAGTFGEHHPNHDLGSRQLKTCFEAPTYQPPVDPPDPMGNARISRTYAAAQQALYPCIASPTDDIINVFIGGATPVPCLLPDMASTAEYSANNQAVVLTFNNTGAAPVTISAQGGSIWDESGVTVPSSKSISVIATNQYGNNPGRWYTVGRSFPFASTCKINGGSTYTILLADICIFTSAGTTAFTWPTSGFTVGTYYQIYNSSTTGDATFTNLTTAAAIHPNCNGQFLASTTTGVKYLGQTCTGTTYVQETNMPATTYTLLPTDARLVTSNTSTTTVALPTTWAAGANIPVRNKGTTAVLFSGATAGTAQTGAVLPGSQSILRSNGAASWDIWADAPGRATTASIGGGSLAAGACASGTAALAGVTAAMALGQPSASVDPGAGFQPTAVVTTTGTITVRVCNISGATATPGAATYVVTAWAP